MPAKSSIMKFPYGINENSYTMNLTPFRRTLLKPRIHTDIHGCHFDNPCISVVIRGFSQVFLKPRRARRTRRKDI
jgi:hypothetical protein